VLPTFGTGINAWWRYQEENVPGGGHVMINIGTGNLLLQDDDMSIAHKGVALAFRRTYNSQSQHDVNGTDGSAPSMFGNGWTSTFDAHLSSSAPSSTTVWDIDGTRYDYSLASDGTWTPPAGQHATLTWDGGCGYLWTKKSGTSYYFWQAANGPCGPSYGGLYAGKLYQIIGRNRNTYVTFGYSWDIGTHTAGDKVSAINATTESGMTATLYFGDVSGHRLLHHIAYPDTSTGPTTVYYGYDAAGNLTWVSQPSNNAARTRPLQTFGYDASGGLMTWAGSPRWNEPDGGALLYFSYNGTTALTATVSGVSHFGVVNPSIPDGTGVLLQPGAATGVVDYKDSWYGTGGSSAWFHDTDGHSTNWVMDVQRPTQTQVCTAMSGWTCTGTWLVSNETWNQSTNDRLSEVDARGYTTEYAYDQNGNTIAVGQPAVVTSSGTFRPTRLFSYDANNNVTAVCDQLATHVLGKDWPAPPGPPPAGQNLCPQTSVAMRFHWISVAAEPFGELATSTTPGTPAARNGYTKTFSYDPAAQGGADYGLVTSVIGDPISQTPGGQAPAVVSPTQSFQFDANGNEVCYSNGSGTWAAQYDSLNRQTVVADPDDGSISGCGKAASASHAAHYTRYFPNGQVQYTETPVQHAADVASGSMGAAVAFAYDLDGNELTQTHHHGCAGIANCIPGTTTKWYDAADRLIEVMQPYDASVDFHTYKWMTRYLYDLSAGGTHSLTIPASSTTSAASTSGFASYGNLYDTQSFVDLGFSANDSSPRWVDHLDTAYDALDRKTARYDIAIGVTPLHRYLYDQTPSTLDFQSTDIMSTGEAAIHDYDGVGNSISTTFTYPGGAPPSPSAAAAPSRNFTYDADGRVTSIQSVLGTQFRTYDANGDLLTDVEPASQGGNSVIYGYTANGWRSSLSTAGALNRQLFAYSYRPDGRLAQQQVNDNGWRSFTWTYTAAGRLLQRADPSTGSAINPSGGIRSDFESVFQPLSYAYDSFENKTSVTYSDGYAVNGITTDLEGNQSAETDTRPASPPYVATHTSMPRRFSARDEVAFEGPFVTNGLSTMTEYANGIQLAMDAQTYSGGPPMRGVQLTLLRSGPPASPLNPLDGFEGSSAGSYSSNTVGTDYSNTVAYDAAGRLTITDFEQCSLDSADRLSLSSWSETTTLATYDAENHTTSQSLNGSQGIDSVPGPCSWPKANSATANYGIFWGTTGHPYRLTISTSTVVSEYMHWDGDTLLYTSSAPGSGVDDIKIGGFAEVTPSDGNIAIYDRDSGGTIIDGHTTSWSTSNVSYNDAFDTTGKTPVLALCYAYGLSAPCIVITEPKPENLSGYAGFNIQGVRGVDGSLGHWTTPDALLATSSDPSSQLPFMYSGNNPYKYSDPTGYRIEFRASNSDDKKEAEASYDEAISYFDRKGGAEAAAFLRKLRDDPSFTIIAYVNMAGKDLKETNASASEQGAVLRWDTRSGLFISSGKIQSPAMGLLHEADHAYRIATDRAGYEADAAHYDSKFGSKEEQRVVEGMESRTAALIGEPVRADHFGTPCIVKTPITGTSC